jgi:hypothetical protein
VGKEHLPRREAARIRLGNSRSHTEERDLESVRTLLLVLHPASDVPPLEAIFGMAALVARELQFRAGEDGRVRQLGACGGKAKKDEK